MALFYIFGCIDTGSCSQTQRPLTHQSKKLLCSAAPHHAKVLSLLLSLHLLCALSPTSSFSELILLHTTQSSRGFLPPSVQSLSNSPNLPLYSHSPLFLFTLLLPCLHFLLPLYPSHLTFSLSHVLRLWVKTALQATSRVLTDFRSVYFKGVCTRSSVWVIM